MNTLLNDEFYDFFIFIQNFCRRYDYFRLKSWSQPSLETKSFYVYTNIREFEIKNEDDIKEIINKYNDEIRYIIYDSEYAILYEKMINKSLVFPNLKSIYTNMTKCDEMKMELLMMDFENIAKNKNFKLSSNIKILILLLHDFNLLTNKFEMNCLPLMIEKIIFYDTIVMKKNVSIEIINMLIENMKTIKLPFGCEIFYINSNDNVVIAIK